MHQYTIHVSGNLASFLKVTSKLKLGAVEDEYTVKLYPSLKPLSDAGNTDNSGFAKTGRSHCYVFIISDSLHS